MYQQGRKERFARYVAALTDSARRHGVSGIPFMINIHGTEGGDGVPFAIGVSQLFEGYAGQDGIIAGSDHYLGRAHRCHWTGGRRRPGHRIPLIRNQDLR